MHTKEIQLTPLTIETKTIAKKDGSGTFDKVEITAELPNAGKVWLKAFPERAQGIEVGVPFWAIVKATPKTNGGFFYDFEVVGSPMVASVPAPQQSQPREIGDGDAIRAMHLSLEAIIKQEFAAVNQKIDALIADKEMDELTSGAVAKGF